MIAEITEHKTETHTQTQSAPHEPPARPARSYNIPGDTVFTATADLTDDERNAIRWLHNFGSENNISYADLGKMLKKPDGSSYDGNTIFKVLTGKHEAKLQNITKSIFDLKRIIEERSTITRVDFIETHLSRSIFKICDTALKYQKIQFIFGDFQVGKTTALEEYERTHNHGQTVYLRMPEGGGLYDLIYELAIKLKISGQAREIKHRITRSFDARMLLIVDEAHQSFLTTRSNSRIRALEFIREIHDRSKCGVVICASGLLEREIASGAQRNLLKQLTRRALEPLALPDRPEKADLDTFARHYKLAPAAGEALQLQTSTIRDHGLGKWCTLLQAASSAAHKDKERLTWEHVLDADAHFTRIRSPK